MIQSSCIEDSSLRSEPTELSPLFEIKRFAERWSADDKFREYFRTNPEAAIADYGLKVSMGEAQFMAAPASFDSESQPHPIVRRMREVMLQSSLSCPEDSEQTSVKDARLRAWRRRNHLRLASQMRLSYNNLEQEQIVSFELSKGCSVGCWFCCVASQPLSQIFAYTPENAKLWRQVLTLLNQKLGSSVADGVCFWATDPLDNPDYEKFCLDFYHTLGVFPRTTTAQAAKNPERTRAFLKLSQENGGCHLRFSILSLGILNKVHQEFTAEELNFVHLVFQNKEAEKAIKVEAGRARERKQKEPSISNQFIDSSATIVSLTGFLFNMVERRVKLISPCLPCDRWPTGCRIHAEATFTDSEDLEQIIESMIDRYMPLTVRAEELISFRQDLQYIAQPDGFQLASKLKTFNFRRAPYLKELGELIAQGNKTAQEIAGVFAMQGMPEHQTFRYLNQLFERGLLDDEPEITHSDSKEQE